MPVAKTPEAEAERRRKISESHARRRAERALLKPKPERRRKLCVCGCGREVTPGARFIRGHSGGKARKKKQTAQSMAEEMRQRALAMPLTTMCAHCGAEKEGVVAETAEWFRQHAKTCPGLVREATDGGPAGRLVHQTVAASV